MINRKIKAAILTWGLLTLGEGLWAQEILNLNQCVEMALRYNKELTAAGKQTESAAYMSKSYKGNFFPNLTARGMGGYSTADGSYQIEGGNLPIFTMGTGGIPIPNGSFAYFPGINLDYEIADLYMGGVQLEQPIYMGGKIKAAYKMSVLGREMSEINEQLVLNKVVLQVNEAFAGVVKAQEMKKVATRYHQLLEELYRNVESACKQGMKSNNDRLKVQVKLNESELSMRKVENALKLATMNLCHYIGKPLDAEVYFSGGFPIIEDEFIAHSTGVENRPESRILDKQLSITKQQVKLERSSLLPQVGLLGGYAYTYGGALGKESLFDGNSFSVLLNVSIPLYHFGVNHNKVKSAKVKLEQQQLEQQNLKEQMVLELNQAVNRFDEAQLEKKLATKSLQQAEENMRVSKSQYDNGMESLSDYLEAQAMWQKAFEAKIDIDCQIYVAYIEYLKATGELSVK